MHPRYDYYDAETVFLCRLFSDEWYIAAKSNGWLLPKYRSIVGEKLSELIENGSITPLELEFIELRCHFRERIYSHKEIAHMKEFFGGKAVSITTARLHEVKLFRKLRKAIKAKDFLKPVVI